MSKVTIFNSACGIIGGNNKGLILSDNEEGSIADHCREFYEEAVDISVIWLRPYKYIAYKSIAYTSNTVAKSDWSYAYAYPSNVLELIKYTDENSRIAEYDYDIIDDGDGNKYIVSDQSDCYLHYIKKPNYDDTTTMGAMLRRLIAANLAVLIAPFVKPKMLQVAEAQLEKWETRTADMNASHIYVEEIESSADIQ